MNVLLVDDDEDLRLIAGAALERYAGATVTEADSLPAALAALQRTLPDVVITDLRLGGPGGDELLSAIRADARTTALPVVVLTAASEAAVAADLAARGVTLVITKPFVPERFAATIRGLLRET